MRKITPQLTSGTLAPQAPSFWRGRNLSIADPHNRLKISVFLASSVLALALAGCSTGLAPESFAPVATPATKIVNGSFHGGQQPVSGANIQLFAVGATGLQSAATLLNTATITTNANGQFTTTGSWNCTANPSAYGTNPEIYLVATGGNPGLAAGTNNTAIAAMAALGPCSNFTPTSYVSINERTTVASTYALAPFMADATHLGAQGIGATGLVNAFSTAVALENSANGANTVPGASLPANTAAPTAQINTLADVIAVCINSSGTDTLCSTLFGYAQSSGGVTPTNTIAALLNIAKNPGANVANLFATIPAAPPFSGIPTSAPNDFTVALNITGGGLASPAGIALDANGNAWVANAGGNSVTELSGTGTPLTGSGGYAGSNNLYGAQAIAVDRSGSVWVADTLLSTVVQLAVSGGTVQSNTSYSAGGINGPTGIAIDSANNVWVSNFAGGSVTELTNQGAVVGASPLTAGGTLQAPSFVAIDKTGNVWVTDNSAGVVAEFASNQTLLSGAGYTDNAMVAPIGIALDASGRVSVADSGNNAVTLFSAAGVAAASSPVSGGGINAPTAVATDGQGMIWVANAGSISELAYGSAPISPASGFGTLSAPAAIAIDASGNVWTANSGDNSVSVFLGLAMPVATPIAVNVGP